MVGHRKAKTVSTNIRTSPDVEIAIYTDGPAHIMKATKPHLNAYIGFDPKNEKVDTRSSCRPTMYGDDEQMFTWNPFTGYEHQVDEGPLVENYGRRA
ncbi:hypothetical protein AB5N19_02125 [Seiridium cardinale]